jgi:regulator of protease activity HflC (stomatin/prohibitin superfamily)
MNDTRKIIGISCAFVGIVALLVVIFCSWGTIDAGHRGVVLSMGKVTGEIKGEGFYTKIPWIVSVVEADIRMQKEQVETEGASKDLQTVKADIALNLSIEPSKCADLYQSIGRDYLDKFVAPSMQESIKAVLAQFTAEELISKRECVRESMGNLLSSKLAPVGIKTSALNIVDLDFSPSFNSAIEAKVTAEQNALAAKNLLAQKEFEAQQLIATAKGKAEAMQIESAALAKNPQVLQLRALEKWNGVLPHVMSGDVVPFIDITEKQDNVIKR